MSRRVGAAADKVANGISSAGDEVVKSSEFPASLEYPLLANMATRNVFRPSFAQVTAEK